MAANRGSVNNLNNRRAPNPNVPNARPPRRRISLATAILSALATALALITLLGLAPLPGVPESASTILSQLSSILIQLVTVVGAIAVIIGVINLFAVHWNKLRAGGRAAPYNLITLLVAILIVVVHLADRAGLLKALEPGYTAGDTPLVSITLMDAIQVAIKSALAGLLLFFLVYAAYRLMRRRVTIWSILFVVTLLIVLLGYIPLTYIGFLTPIREWLLRVPVSAGTRGILIGVALGTITVGVRLLLGQDQSFRE